MNLVAAVLTTLALLDEPTAVTVGPSGAIYVCEGRVGRISAFDSSGNLAGQFGSRGAAAEQLDHPRGVAVAPDGTLFVADTGNHRIALFDPRGRSIGGWGRFGSAPGEFNEPVAVAVDRTMVVVADARNDRVQIFDHAGNLRLHLWSYGYHDGAFDRPVAVALDADGNIYVTDQGNARLQKFDSLGRFVATWSGRGAVGPLVIEPRAMTLAADRLLLLDPPSGRRLGFDREGRWLGSWPAIGSTSLALFPDGSRLVSCSASTRSCVVEPVVTASGSVASATALELGEHRWPLHVAAGRAFVADPDSGGLRSIDLRGKRRRWGPRLGSTGHEPLAFVRPDGLWFDGVRQRLWVADGGNRRLQQLQLQIDGTATLHSALDLADPEALLVDPGRWELEPAGLEPGDLVAIGNDRLAVIDRALHRIVLLDRSYRLVGSFGSYAELRDPRALAFDPRDRQLVVLDGLSRRVVRFRLDGRIVGSWPIDATDPIALAVTPAGRLLVLDAARAELLRLTSAGRELGRWGRRGTAVGSLADPRALAVDPQGRILVLDSGGRRLQAFATDGRFFWASDLPTATTPTPAPIPATTTAPRRWISTTGRYEVVLRPATSQFPRGTPFDLAVEVFDREPARQLAKYVILDVDGAMPAHGHGLTVKPTVTATDSSALQDLLPGHGARGDGRFVAHGLLLHMPGRWDLYFDLRRGAITERVVVPFDLE